MGAGIPLHVAGGVVVITVARLFVLKVVQRKPFICGILMLIPNLQSSSELRRCDTSQLM